MFGSYHALNNLDVFQVAHKHFLTYLRSSRKENYMNASAHRRTVCPKKMIKRRTLKGIPKIIDPIYLESSSSHYVIIDLDIHLLENWIVKM